MYEDLKKEAAEAFEELLSQSHFRKGSLIVIGGSFRGNRGGRFGEGGAPQVADAIFRGLSSVFSPMGVYLAAQCCEHLNRALIVERETAEKYGYEEVTVVPWLHGGGSFATNAYYHFRDPVAVEEIKADGGLDIGLTLIGMHLKRVAVPVHLTHNRVGEAIVTGARTRPPLIGGERARYKKDDNRGAF